MKFLALLYGEERDWANASEAEVACRPYDVRHSRLDIPGA